jgi:zinc protease
MLKPERIVLDNGVVLVSKETRTTPAVSINLAVRAGSICDAADAPGVMWLLSRVIDRGTAMRSAADIAEDLDGRGITLAVTVTRHLTSLTCTCLAEDFDPVFGLLGEMLMAPSFPEREIATRKGEVITAIRQDEDNPAVQAAEGVMALLYPDGHPYGRSVKGSAAAVEGFSRAQIVALHAARCAPGELAAVVVGDVEVARVQDTAARVFAGWRVPGPAPVVVPAPALPSTRRRRVVSMMNKAQADIAYGFISLRRSDPRYYACQLMNHVLGQYSMGGRLGDSIREKQGMAYYVGSALDANVAEGPLVVRAGVSPGNVDRAVAAIDTEVGQLARDGMTSAELEDSRRYLIGAMPRALETNAAIARFLLEAEFFGLGLDHDVRLPGLLRAVTLDEANAEARRILDPDRATVVIAGPYADA